MRVPWLGDVLRDVGLPVVKVGNPLGRGRAMATVYGVVVHDTVTTSAWSDERVDALLRDGRPGVPGPLSQLGLDRQGRFRWVADGRCNHNGFGAWGNNTVGIEVYCAGGLKNREEPWNDAQREAVVVASRAILDHLDLGRSSLWNPRVAGHKETDPSRKVDPYRVDMARLRADVAAFKQAPSDEEDPTMFVTTEKTSVVWFVTGNARVRLRSKQQANELDPNWRDRLRVLSSDHPLFELPEVR